MNDYLKNKRKVSDGALPSVTSVSNHLHVNAAYQRLLHQVHCTVHILLRITDYRLHSTHIIIKQALTGNYQLAVLI